MAKSIIIKIRKIKILPSPVKESRRAVIIYFKPFTAFKLLKGRKILKVLIALKLLVPGRNEITLIIFEIIY